MFAKFFIDRPIFAWVIALIILLGGALALKKWGIQLNTVMLVFQNGIKHTESPACLAKGWD